jgi:hypothetical protein
MPHILRAKGSRRFVGRRIYVDRRTRGCARLLAGRRFDNLAVVFMARERASGE